MKINRLKGSLLLGGALLAGLGGLAVAQTAPATSAAPPPPAIAAAPAPVNPATLPELRGKVAQYDLTGRGDVNGLILADGTEILFPPHLGPAVQAGVHPGDDVTVRGVRNGTVVMAASVAGPSGTPVVDRGPGDVGNGRPSMDASGTVKMALHGPRGEVNGVLLDDGTIIRMPPDQAAQRTDALQPGRTVAVRGDGSQSPAGRVIEARAFGPSADKLTDLPVPPPRPARPGPAGALAPSAPPPPPPRG